MVFNRFFAVLSFVVAIAACGGGGGNPGSNPNSPAVPAPPVKVAKLAMNLVDAAGAEVIDRSLSQTASRYLRVVLTDIDGQAVSFSRVNVTLDSTKARLVPSSGVDRTNADGVLLMPIGPADVTAAGQVLVSASASVGGATLNQTLELLIVPGVVALNGLTVSPPSVQSGQSVNVTVNALVNGIKPASNALAVVFTSSCGVVSPVSSLLDNNGQATAVIQTAAAGNCSVVASASGAVSSSATLIVTAPPITGIRFVGASPAVIYQAGSVGPNTSLISFRVVNSLGAAVPGVNVTASLSNSDGGINFCGSPSSGTSGADGLVTFSVCPGTLPATVQVRATLDAYPLLTTNSNLLTIQTGVASQRFFDVSANKLNFYVGGQFTSQTNGNSVDITAYAADRQGNPVPNGTKVVFVSEGGQLNSGGESSCTINAGSCSVRLIGQAYRPLGSTAMGGDPRPGRVTVLAYADGEEHFIDANNNNRYDPGELFEDLGLPYLDKDENRTFLAAYTNLVTGTDDGDTSYPLPAGAFGAAACPSNSNVGLSVAGTCNATWDGNTKVRRAIVVIFSGGEIGQPGAYHPSIPAVYQTVVLSASTAAVTVRLSDYNGNPLPADAALSVQTFPVNVGGVCVASLEGSVVGSTTEATSHTATLKGCASGDTVRFTATIAGGAGAKVSSLSVVLP